MMNKKLAQSECISGISVWKWATYISGVIFFLLSVRWSLLDRSPPAWDQGMYLFQASTISESFKISGFHNFIQSILNIDKGRVPLLLVVVQPAFLIFGPSLDAAVISINVFWFLLLWSIIGIAKQISAEAVQDKAGFFSFTLFSLYPLTLYLSHNFLVEFILVALVSSSLYSLMMANQTQSRIWSFSAGFWIGCGLLTKVTFPAFVFPSIFFMVVSHIKKHGFNLTIRLYWLMAILPLLIAGPYYFNNIREILQLTTFLSSSGLSQMYGFRQALDLIAIKEFLWSIFTDPVLMISLLCIGFSLILSSISVKRYTNTKIINSYDKSVWLIMMGLWFGIPLVLTTLGTIKESRYLYPALIPVFILAGVSAARANFRFFGFGFMLIFYVVATPAYLVNNNLLKGENFDFLRIKSDLNTDSPLDERDWKIDSLVGEMAAGIRSHESKKILFLGGNRYYHLRLLDFYGLIQGVKLQYITLPYYANPNMTLEQALEFIDEQAPVGIISKGGQNWPEFSTRLDPEIIKKLNNNSIYIRNELNTIQPDGSNFTFFVRKLPEFLQVRSSEVFSGIWLVDSGKASIVIDEKGELLITTEAGVRSNAYISGGKITVPAWGVSARITKDLKELHWSNGSKWKNSENKRTRKLDEKN